VPSEPDDNADGDITGITTSATSRLLGGCTFGTCSLSVDPTDFNGSGPIVHTNAVGAVTVTGPTATLDSVTITVPTGGTILVIGSATARAISLDSTNTLAIGDLGLTTVSICQIRVGRSGCRAPREGSLSIRRMTRWRQSRAPGAENQAVPGRAKL
jgi:hypothetical protein